jgi:hypothetical protein
MRCLKCARGMWHTQCAFAASDLIQTVVPAVVDTRGLADSNGVEFWAFLALSLVADHNAPICFEQGIGKK